jgi:hypothetical protein
MTMENKGVKDETKFSEEHKLKSNYKENWFKKSSQMILTKKLT